MKSNYPNHPVSKEVARQASQWLVLLMSGTATLEDQSNWKSWHDASIEHERAWQHIEAVNQRFQGVSARIALPALTTLPNQQRRKHLKTLGFAGIAVGAALFARQASLLQNWGSDYRTGKGERRSVTLADGSRIEMNSKSALDVTFSSKQRMLRLHRGEIMITTGHQQSDHQRPFIVQTHQGNIRALGTRFTVRQDTDATFVAVFEGAVEITSGQQTSIITAGNATSFTDSDIHTSTPVNDSVTAWTQGLFVADKLPLHLMLAEISQYRTGYLGCDPSIANLLVSGVFSLDDTDSTLAALTDALPIMIHYRTRYWTHLAMRK